MNDLAVAIFAASLDAVLNERNGLDLSVEILARAGWINDPAQIDGIRLMVDQSDDRVFGRQHLNRLRLDFLSK